MKDSQKTILILASLFYPQKKSGGPPVSILNLVKNLQDRFHIRIISNNYELNESQPLPYIQQGWNEFSFGRAYYFNRGVKSFWKLLQLIRDVDPDVIYQNSFFSYDDLLPALYYKRVIKPNTLVVVAPRGEFYPNRLARGRLKKKIYLNVVRCSGLLQGVFFHSTATEETQYINSILNISSDRIVQIGNLSRMTSQRVPIHKHKGGIRLLYFSRIHPMKNLQDFLNSLSHSRGGIEFDIFGPIEDENYWRGCKQLIAKLPENISVSYRGVIEYDDIPNTLSNYHVTVLPSDGENFGHSIVDSMIFYRPVLISDQTPWSEIHQKGGLVCKIDKLDHIHELVNTYVDMDDTKYQQYSEYAGTYIRQKLRQDELIQHYVALFSK